MKYDILYKEIVKISQVTKQWVISIVLLLDFIYISLMYYYYSVNLIPNLKFEKDDFVAISVIVFFLSISSIIVVFSIKYTISIYDSKIEFKQKGYGLFSISKNDIDSYNKIDKKNFSKLVKNIERKKKKTYSKMNYYIGYPNYIIKLKDGRNVFIRIYRKAAFNDAMNEILNLRYG